MSTETIKKKDVKKFSKDKTRKGRKVRNAYKFLSSAGNTRKRKTYRKRVNKRTRRGRK